MNERILCIGDLHTPYIHPDTIPFLRAVKKKYRPTRVVLIGDEVDNHALSFHDTDADLPSAGEELKLAIALLKRLYRLFPAADVVDSNHGSMAIRRFKKHGIPLKFIADINTVLEAPKEWRWHLDINIKLKSGQNVFFHHGLGSKDIMKLVAQRGSCVVQGHFHSEFYVGFTGNPDSLLWGMQLGCGLDRESLAFAYDRTNVRRPILGHGIIVDGLPKLLPMLLDNKGRWTGVVP